MTVLMRPTPLEVYAGVQRSLTERVMPHLARDDLRAELVSALGLLRYLAREFDGAAQGLSEEIEDLRAVARDVAPALRSAGHEETAARLEECADATPPDLRVSSLLAHSDPLQEALLEAVLTVERGTEAGAAGLDGAREALRAALVRLNARRRPA